MSKAIVIASTGGRKHWISQALASLDGYTRYPIILLTHYEYELGKIRWIYEHTDLSEFLLLQDTVVIKQTEWIDKAFDYPHSVSVSLSPFFMYLGKYRREVLDKLALPQPANKREAVRYEGEWTAQYHQADPDTLCMFADMMDTEVYAEHNGRQNMILENDHLIKYKGTWNPSMVADSD